MERKINARWKQRVAVRNKTRIRSSEVSRVVTQKEASVGIRSSGLAYSEILQDTLEGKHRGSGWCVTSKPKVRSYVLH